MQYINDKEPAEHEMSAGLCAYPPERLLSERLVLGDSDRSLFLLFDCLA
jgi:hypothetical protein